MLRRRTWQPCNPTTNSTCEASLPLFSAAERRVSAPSRRQEQPRTVFWTTKLKVSAEQGKRESTRASATNMEPQRKSNACRTRCGSPLDFQQLPEEVPTLFGEPTNLGNQLHHTGATSKPTNSGCRRSLRRRAASNTAPTSAHRVWGTPSRLKGDTMMVSFASWAPRKSHHFESAGVSCVRGCDVQITNELVPSGGPTLHIGACLHGGGHERRVDSHTRRCAWWEEVGAKGGAKDAEHLGFQSHAQKCWTTNRWQSCERADLRPASPKLL